MYIKYIMRNVNYIFAVFLIILVLGNYIYNNYYIEGMNDSRKDQPWYIFGLAAFLIYLLLTKKSPTILSP